MKVIHGLLGFGIQKISSNLCINMKHDSTCVMAFAEYQANNSRLPSKDSDTWQKPFLILCSSKSWFVSLQVFFFSKLPSWFYIFEHY